MQGTYFLIIETNKADLSINENYEALKIDGYYQEIDFTFKKEKRPDKLPVLKSNLVFNQKIFIDKIDANLTPSLFNYLMECINMYKSMIMASSIKSKINGMLLNEEFLKDSVLFINQ